MHEFGQLRDSLISKLVSLTQAAKAIKPSEIIYLRSNSIISSKMDILSDKLLASINKSLEYSQIANNHVRIFDNSLDVEDRFDIAVDTIDNLFEKADSILDSSKKHGKKVERVPIIFNSTKVNEKYLFRPQLTFKDKVDNSNTPWTPIIKYKPNSLNSNVDVSDDLQIHISSIRATHPHPYEYEIQNIQYPVTSFVKRQVVGVTQIEKSKCLWVSKKDQLLSLCEALNECTEFAVDLEHHDYRSFLGFTCLIQISTRSKDYIIDALELRSELHLLNETFTNPSIVKVLHGAEMDVQWLQKDFGIYIVNLFDTYHASHVLQMDRHGYAFLLNHYCEIIADKQYQTADWRQRPLPIEMSNYAQSDTHYLLYIYDMMSNELLDKPMGEFESPLQEVFDRSAQTSLKKYVKPIYDAELGEGPGGWLNVVKKCTWPLNDKNIAVLRAIHGWRDHIARKEDESANYILPTYMLMNMCRYMPINAGDLIAGCTPTPPFVRLCAVELAAIINDAVKTTKVFFEKPSPKSTIIPISATQKSNALIESKATSISIEIIKKTALFGNILQTEKAKPSKMVRKIKSEFKLTPGDLEFDAIEIVEEPRIIPQAHKLTGVLKVLSDNKRKAVELEDEDGNSVMSKSASPLLQNNDEDQVPAQLVQPAFKKIIPANFRPYDYDKAIVETVKVPKSKPFNPTQDSTDDGPKAAKKRKIGKRTKSVSYNK